MKLRIILVYEPDGPREFLEVAPLRCYLPELIDLDQLKAGRVEWVQLPESIFVEYGEWQEFPDNIYNRHTLLALFGKLTGYRNGEFLVNKDIADILKPVVKEMKPFSPDISGRPAKEGIAGIKVMDWKNPPSPSRLRVSAERTAEKALSAAARLREFIKRNPFPWVSRK